MPKVEYFKKDPSNDDIPTYFTIKTKYIQEKILKLTEFDKCDILEQKDEVEPMRNYGKWITAVLVTIAILVGLFYPRDRDKDRDPDTILPVVEKIPENDYVLENFYWEDGFLHYKDRNYMIGIDVSTHQEEVDWQSVADSGVEFAILRVGFRGSTAGSLYEDDYFARNLIGAKNVGLKVGVYFFSQAMNEEEAREEARYACDLLDGTYLELPVFYDWEYLEGRVPEPWLMPMTQCAVAFCEEIEDEGYDAGVYFNQDYGYNYLDLREIDQYALWLAEYGSIPEFPYLYQCVQYTDSGSIPGIEGPVDLNLMFIE